MNVRTTVNHSKIIGALVFFTLDNRTGVDSSATTINYFNKGITTDESVVDDMK